MSRFTIVLIFAAIFGIGVGQCVKANKAKAEPKSSTWAVSLNVTTNLKGYEECVQQSVTEYFKTQKVSIGWAPYEVSDIHIEMIVGESSKQGIHLATAVVTIKPLILKVPPSVVLTAVIPMPEGRQHICKLPADALNDQVNTAARILKLNGKGI